MNLKQSATMLFSSIVSSIELIVDMKLCDLLFGAFIYSIFLNDVRWCAACVQRERVLKAGLRRVMQIGDRQGFQES